MQSIKIMLLACLFLVFYRPVGKKAWVVWAAYDTKEEAEAQEIGEGGPYEYRIVKMEI